MYIDQCKRYRKSKLVSLSRHLIILTERIKNYNLLCYSSIVQQNVNFKILSRVSIFM